MRRERERETRERNRGRERSSFHWFILQLLAMIGITPSQSQESETRSFLWVSRHSNSELGQKQSRQNSNWHSDGMLKCQLNLLCQGARLFHNFKSMVYLGWNLALHDIIQYFPLLCWEINISNTIATGLKKIWKILINTFSIIP